jgi:hypothetical protein
MTHLPHGPENNIRIISEFSEFTEIFASEGTQPVLGLEENRKNLKSKTRGTFPLMHEYTRAKYYKLYAIQIDGGDNTFFWFMMTVAEYVSGICLTYSIKYSDF